MSGLPDTVFLRLEGPLQSWSDSKLYIRRSLEAPTKSGVLGLICCAMSVKRAQAQGQLELLHAGLLMAVRADWPGHRWWDYHTVGAGGPMTTAAGTIKPETTVIKRMEYLADASFLVALQGDAEIIERVAAALANPKWPVYLGRKSCPPCVPVFCQPRKDETWTNPACIAGGLQEALEYIPWHPRYAGEEPPNGGKLPALIEWNPADGDVPDDAEPWFDVPFSFEPQAHHARLVVRTTVHPTFAYDDPLQTHCPPPPRPRADYHNPEYRAKREARLKADQGLCVFCKLPATTVQHITYRHAGGDEHPEDLKSLCRLCHDAITMLEYGAGMGMDRIDPEDATWRDDIIRQRAEIIRFRSEEGRRRALRSAPEKVQREVLEEES